MVQTLFAIACVAFLVNGLIGQAHEGPTDPHEYTAGILHDDDSCSDRESQGACSIEMHQLRAERKRLNASFPFSSLFHHEKKPKAAVATAGAPTTKLLITPRMNEALLSTGSEASSTWHGKPNDYWPEYLPDAELDGVAAVKQWTRDRISTAEKSFAAAGGARFASPDSWSNAIIYHVQADRFNNGNVSNDKFNVQEWQLEAEAANDGSYSPSYRHGGDIKGIRDRLGYIADLQANTLWVTPMLHHIGQYAGYCPINPTQIDPAFGTNEDFRELVKEAHSLGIRVVMDVVVNHLCDHDDSSHYDQDSSFLTECTNGMNESFWAGTEPPPEHRLNIIFGDSFFPPLKSQHFFSRCGVCSDSEMRSQGTETIFGDFDDGMFDYDTQNPEFQEIFTNIMKYWIAYADVDAFRLDAAKHVTEDFLAYFSTEVRDYAQSVGKDNFFTIGEIAADPTWVTLKVGRMRANPEDPDKALRVPVGLTQRLKGLRDKYMAHPKFPFPGLNGMYHFEQSGRAVSTMLGHPYGPTDNTMLAADISDYLGSYSYNAVMDQLSLEGEDRLSAAATLWTNSEIHDWPRFLEEHPHKPNMARATLLWVYCGVGAPVLYQGQEQGLNGHCPKIRLWGKTIRNELEQFCPSAMLAQFGEHTDEHKRQDFFVGGPWVLGSAIPEVDQLSYVGPPTRTEAMTNVSWQEDPMLPRNHSLYRTARALGALRKACPAFVHGEMKMRRVNLNPGGFFTFSRLHLDESEDTGIEIVVVIQMVNNTVLPGNLNRMKISPRVNKQDGERYLNVFNTSEVAVTQIKKGNAYLVFDGPRNKIYNDGGAVFIHEDLLLPFDEELGVALCKPGSNAGLA